MKRTGSPLFILTLVNSFLALCLSAAGFFNQQIYTTRLNKITSYELKGQDIITLFMSLIFITIILFTDFRKLKFKIVWLGCLSYFLYIYAYFSLSGITSIFYLGYIAVTALSLFLILFIIADIIKNNTLPQVTLSYPRKSGSIFLLFSIILMTIIEIQELFTQTVITKEALNPFAAFYVLDLGIVFPAIFITAILNLVKNKWGVLFCGIALIKIVTILPAVIFNDLFHWLATDRFIDLPFDIIAIVITSVAGWFLVLYMKGIE